MLFLNYENEDITDRYHYRYTVISFLIFFLLHVSKQYYGEQIQCVTTANAYPSLNNYIHSTCWTNGTHRVIMNKETRQVVAPNDNSTKIYYYQWITFIIIFQCFLFLIPKILWSCSIRLNGFDLVYVCRNVVKKAYLDYYSNNTDRANTSKALQHVSDHLRLSLVKPQKKKVKNSFSVKEISDNKFDLFPSNKENEPKLKANSSFPLYWSYIFVKLMYIVNIFIQFCFLSWVFNFNYFTYGLVTIASIVSKTYEFDNSFFPKTSICIMYTFEIGFRKEYFAYLCSLPMNLLNEIFYFLFWLWLVILFCLTVSSMLFWVRLLLFRIRKEHVRGLMTDLLANITENDQDHGYNNSGLNKNECFENFYRDVCSLDLIFVIDVLTINSTNVFARDILENLWNEYFEIDSK